MDLDPEVIKLIPEPFAMENRVIAIREEPNAVWVAMTDTEISLFRIAEKNIGQTYRSQPYRRSTLTDTLERYYKTIRTTSQVEDAVGNFEFIAVDEEENEITIDSKQGADAPVVKLVNLIIMEAIKSNATDVHIEPQSKKTNVRFRIDGALREVMSPPIGLHAGIVSLIKVMSKLNIAERRLPQDGHISLKLR